MTRTRLSLFYLAGYLTFAGLALLLVPTFALQLLFWNGDYGEVFPVGHPDGVFLSHGAWKT